MPRMRVAVAGGGAAGFFGAIACAERIRDAEVVILEKSPELLAKVLISGGGRCNVTHACFEPAQLVRRYPRGARELLGPFHRWQPRDTMDWFASRGVELKIEADGRVFPASDQAQAIAGCLEDAARKAGVQVRTRCGIESAAPREGRAGFHLALAGGRTLEADRLLIATGGNQRSSGFALAAGLGHTIVDPVPSLFSFDVPDPRLAGLAGISVRDVAIALEGSPLRERGPLLITHEGVSGPAVLRLSAWGARVLADTGYRFAFTVNWLPALDEPGLRAAMDEARRAHGRRAVAAASPFPELPRRLWESLASAAALPAGLPWAGLSRAHAEALLRQLRASRFEAAGKSLNKDEFVTCGGVALREVDFQSMASRIRRGLYFAGEVLDIDGVTGGFNFQAAWTTGWIAGVSMGQEGSA